MEDSKNRLLGIFLIAIGAVLVMDHYHIIYFNIWDLWPLALVYIGLKAERDYFSGNASGRNLLTGATFLTYGLFFLVSEFTTWNVQGNLWPLYIMGPALGFLQMAYYGHRPRANYRTGMILLGISLLFLVENFVNLNYDLILFVGLIAVGLYLLRKPANSDDGYANDSSRNHQEDEDERY